MFTLLSIKPGFALSIPDVYVLRLDDVNNTGDVDETTPTTLFLLFPERIFPTNVYWWCFVRTAFQVLTPPFSGEP